MVPTQQHVPSMTRQPCCSWLQSTLLTRAKAAPPNHHQTETLAKNPPTKIRCLISKSCLTLLGPHGLWPDRLLYPCDFPGKKPGVGCRFLLQGILPIQGSNWHLLHWQADSLTLSHQGRPTTIIGSFYFLLYTANIHSGHE